MRHLEARRGRAGLARMSSPATGHDNLVYGRNALRELIRANRRPVYEILATPEGRKFIENDPVITSRINPGIGVSVADKSKLDRLAPGGGHQGVAARTGPYPYVPWDALETDSQSLVLLLDCLQDPQNFGALCRSALGFGVAVVAIPRDRSVAVTPAVCKASAGAVEHLKIARVTNLARALEDLKKRGFWIYGTANDPGATPLPEVRPAGKSALVLGSEGEGLRPLIAKHCDLIVRIPMRGDFDSLNAAQAGTIFLYEFSSKS